MVVSSSRKSALPRENHQAKLTRRYLYPKMSSLIQSHYDIVVAGGGHNGLVAAAYLARAGLSVLILERRKHVGGAAISERLFPGIDARISAYSYLVSLFPQQIIHDLGLRFET